MNDFDSEPMFIDITPPSSPVASLSNNSLGGKGRSSTNHCFSCLGPVKSSTTSFSSEGLFENGEIPSTLETFQKISKLMDSSRNLSSRENQQTTSLYIDIEKRIGVRKFFGYRFDISEKKELERIIKICRKNIMTIEILANAAFSFSHRKSGIEDQVDVFSLRRDVCEFLSYFKDRIFILRKIHSKDELFYLFKGLWKSITQVKQWIGSLKTHCGFQNGNECSSPYYHLFHLHLELRWYFLTIFELSPIVIIWIFDDLIHLSYANYQNQIENQPGDSIGLLLEKNPFNCLCLKELWCLIKILLDEIKPQDYGFFEHLTRALDRFENEGNVFFPLWLISNLAIIPSSHDGIICEAANGYRYVNTLIKKWLDRGGKTIEVTDLIHRLILPWGFDIDIILNFWTHWFIKIDRNMEVNNLSFYNSSENWLDLIESLCKETISEEVIKTDSFLSFLRLISAHFTKSYKVKEWNKLKSSIFTRISKKVVGDLKEIGLLRLTSLFLLLEYLRKTEIDTNSLFPRFNEILEFVHTNRKKTVLRSLSTFLVLLLKRGVNVSQMCSSFMKIVDCLIAENRGSNDPSKKELIMIYINFLSMVPSVPSLKLPNDSILTQDDGHVNSLNLGQEKLISLNLTMWLDSCGPNYLTRTLRVLHSICTWIFKNSFTPMESEIGSIIFNKTGTVLMSKVISNETRFPQVDIEAMAELAVDLTKFSSDKNKYFDHFVLNERTSPEISEFYYEKLSQEFSGIELNLFNEMKLLHGMIRLLGLGLKPPTVIIEKFIPKNPEAGFKEYCLLIRFSKSAGHVKAILSPLVALVKGAGTLFAKFPHYIKSIVEAAIDVITILPFPNIYKKGEYECFVYHVFNSWIPFTYICDKMPEPLVSALGQNLHKILTILFKQKWTQDQYLRRKVIDIILIGILSFKFQKCEDSHPALKLLDLAWGLEDEVRKVLIEDLNLAVEKFIWMEAGNSKQFLDFLIGLANHLKKASPILLVFLPHVISVYIGKSGRETSPELQKYSFKIIIFSMNGDAESVKRGFKNEMEKQLGFRAGKFFQLFKEIVLCDRMSAKKMLKYNILPLIKEEIERCEEKRGHGIDLSLRQQLEKLTTDLGNLNFIE